MILKKKSLSKYDLIYKTTVLRDQKFILKIKRKHEISFIGTV